MVMKFKLGYYWVCNAHNALSCTIYPRTVKLIDILKVSFPFSFRSMEEKIWVTEMSFKII